MCANKVETKKNKKLTTVYKLQHIKNSERFEPMSHFISRLSMIVRANKLFLSLMMLLISENLYL